MAQAEIVSIVSREGETPPTDNSDTAAGRASALNAAHAQLAAYVAALKPPRILGLVATTAELEARGEYLDQLLHQVADYVGTVVAEAAEYSPYALDLSSIEALLSDLGGDIRGEFNRCADKMREDQAADRAFSHGRA